MTYVTVEEVKDQLSIEQDNDQHDTRIVRLIAAAELWAANFLDAPLVNYEDSPVESPPTIPEDMKSALLLHIEMEFDRDERLMELLLKRAEQMLWPYRIEGLGL